MNLDEYKQLVDSMTFEELYQECKRRGLLRSGVEHGTQR